MNGKRPATANTWTDPDDAPELTEAWFVKADLYQGAKRLRKGGRPKSPAPKQAINIRLSPEVLAYFRATGKGWQSRVNAILQKYMQAHRGG
ncbi:MAG: BrnA antitoxin family protein [Rhodospirillales bacterium]|nr:BrnA antitoxin family protein [Rhodospirillales bacterium]